MTGKPDISVPEGYFQELREKLEAIPARGAARPAFVKRAAPYLAYAASLAVLAVTGNFILRQTAAPAEEDTGWDYISYLAQSLDPDGLVEELGETYSLTGEDIYQYLVEGNLSLEQLETLRYEEDY